MVFVIHPCPVCGNTSYRSWEPYVYDDGKGPVHSTREVCLVCAKRGPMWWRRMWCWLDDRTQQPRRVLIAIGMMTFGFAMALGMIVGAATTR